MGDNVYLGDRNGVRTPMQWTADRNGGFSRADPARLYAPLIMDPVYGYQSVNVEAQERSPFSLLNWMRRIDRAAPAASRPSAAARSSCCGRRIAGSSRSSAGSIRRRSDPRRRQSGEDDAAGVARPVGVRRARAGRDVRRRRSCRASRDAPYFLTLGPYAFYWLQLQRQPTAPVTVRAIAPAAEETVESLPLLLGPDWAQMLSRRDASAPRARLSGAVPAPAALVLPGRRAPGRADRGLGHASRRRSAAVPHPPHCQVRERARGSVRRAARDHFWRPGCGNREAAAGGRGRARRRRAARPPPCRARCANRPRAVFAHRRRPGHPAQTRTGARHPGARVPRRARIGQRRGPRARAAGARSREHQRAPGRAVPPEAHSPHRTGREPGSRAGPVPDRRRAFTRAPRLAGAIEYRPSAGSPLFAATASTAGVLQAFVPHQMDGWRQALGELGRYLEAADGLAGR